jgi:SAM-dependent methyltransferase
MAAIQTPAEKYLVQKLVSLLRSKDNESNARQILNAGAGQSVSIEEQLTEAGCRYVCDRADVENCAVKFPTVRDCWQCSIDDMRPVNSGRYGAVFANYVLEHVEKIREASQEIWRVLAPGGLFIATVPNSAAPEFALAKHTPLWFHRLIRGGSGWETKYAYNGISELLDLFLDVGFHVEDEKYWPFVEQYLLKYPVVGQLSKLYDRIIAACRCRRFMGDVCLVLKKPS